MLPNGAVLVDPTALEEQVRVRRACMPSCHAERDTSLRGPQEARGVATFALLERVKAANAPSGEACADDVVLSSVSGKLSGAPVAPLARTCWR